MTVRQRAATAAGAAIILWLTGWYIFGATIGIDLGDGNTQYGSMPGFAVMGLSLLVLAAAGVIFLLMWGIAWWISEGDY